MTTDASAAIAVDEPTWSSPDTREVTFAVITTRRAHLALTVVYNRPLRGHRLRSKWDSKGGFDPFSATEADRLRRIGQILGSS
jgi:hypothetical protein